MKLVDTLTCEECGAPVLEVYEPAIVLLAPKVQCKKHGGSMEGIRFHLPDDAEVPAHLRYVG